MKKHNGIEQMYFIDPKLGNDAVAALKTDTKNKLHSNYSVKVKVKRGKKKKKREKDGDGAVGWKTTNDKERVWLTLMGLGTHQPPSAALEEPRRSVENYCHLLTDGSISEDEEEEEEEERLHAVSRSVKKKIKFCFFPSTLSLFWFLIFFFCGI